MLGCGDDTRPTQPDPAPLPTGAPQTPREHACDVVARAALAGEPPRPAPGSSLEGAALVEALRELVDCRAVGLDDVEVCDAAPPAVEANCRARWRFFHDGRRPGARWPRVMADALRVECVAEVPAILCDRLHTAVARSDPDACPPFPGALTTLCEGIAAADPGRCDGDPDCRELAGRMRLLVEGGLPRVAEAGTPRDRVTARAALDGVEACDAWIPAFREACAR